MINQEAKASIFIINLILTPWYEKVPRKWTTKFKIMTLPQIMVIYLISIFLELLLLGKVERMMMMLGGAGAWKILSSASRRCVTLFYIYVWIYSCKKLDIRSVLYSTMYNIFYEIIELYIVWTLLLHYNLYANLLPFFIQRKIQ